MAGANHLYRCTDDASASQILRLHRTASGSIRDHVTIVALEVLHSAWLRLAEDLAAEGRHRLQR